MKSLIDEGMVKDKERWIGVGQHVSCPSDGLAWVRFCFEEEQKCQEHIIVIGISFDKTHFTCIRVNLSRFKMIITNG